MGMFFRMDADWKTPAVLSWFVPMKISGKNPWWRELLIGKRVWGRGICRGAGFAVAMLLWLLFGSGVEAAAAWLWIGRDDAVAAGTVCRHEYFDPQGRSFALEVANNAPQRSRDEAIELPVEGGEVAWAILIPKATARNLDQGLILQGVEERGSFKISEVIPVAEPAGQDQPAKPRAGRAAVIPGRAAWVWDPGQWQKSPAALLASLLSRKIGTVYVTIPVSLESGAIESPRPLGDFTSAAAGKGIRVWAVLGDPRAVLPAERPKFARWARAYAAYNEKAAESERIAGVQYDIEPYLVPGYALDPTAWNEAFAKTIALLKSAAPGLPLEVALPWWIARDKVGDTLLLDRLAQSVDGIAVMDYRTEPDQIVRFVIPFLEWGERHHRNVRIGLEAGKIGDEIRKHYRPAETGDLWLLPVGDHQALVQLKRRHPNPKGQAFAWSRDSIFRGSTLTFHGAMDRLDALVPDLEKAFGLWPSFGGIALHGLALDESR